MADQAHDGLLREIDEELRQEHYAKLWKQYGNYVIAAAALLILGTTAFLGWREYDTKTRAANSEAYALAQGLIQQGRPDEAATAFADLTTEARGGYATLARLQEASIKASQNKPAEAAALYREIAADSHVPALYRNLAIVLGAYQEVDSGEPAAITAKVAPLLNGNSPWRHSAREVTGLAAVKAGDKAKARDAFRALAQDTTAPVAMRQRAGDMLAILGS